MSAVGALELAIALALDHEAGGGAGARVIPVLDSELERNHEVYDAVFRRLDGTYLAVDRMTEPKVAGTVEPAFASTLAAGLKASALGLEVEIVQDGPLVAVLRSDGVVARTESELLILAFVAALFHEELGTHRIAAISWTDERLDEISQEAIWELIRIHINARRIGTLSTLVLIAGGHSNPDIHCDKEPSVRYAVGGSGLAKRKGPTSLDTIVNKLSKESTGPFVFFLGAGASASAKMPLGNAVRDYALESFLGDHASAPIRDLVDRFHRWVKENDRLLVGEEHLGDEEFLSRITLERVLREEFRREGRDRSPTLKHLLEQNTNATARKMTRIRRGLATILERPNLVVIVTVNFDTILEDEFEDRIRVFASPMEFDEAPAYVAKYLAGSEAAIPVLKLHGTLADPSTIVADVDTRSLGLPAGASEVLHTLRGVRRPDPIPWVYIGTSMRDPDITELIGSTDFADGLDEWWVAPFPDPAVASFASEHRTARWSNKGRPALWERQVTETADKFVSQLAQVWPDKT
jgi:hypothetical protein